MTIGAPRLWNVTKLSSLATSITSGKSIRRPSSGPFLLYGSTGPIGRTDIPEFNGPSILVARVGANAGYVYEVDGSYGISDNTLVIKLGPGRSTVFLAEILRHMNLNSMVYGSGQPLVTGTMLKHLKVPDLSYDEEQAIASYLTAAAREINALKRLIAKKEAIKQGMVQQLVTGETRLPEFTGTWRNCHLGDIVTVRHGRNQRGVETNGGTYPILASGGEIGRSDTPLYTEPSVLIGRKGTIDRPQFQPTPFWCVDTLFYTEIDDSADSKYLFYIFETVDWRSMNEASGVPSLNARLIESVPCLLPPVDEQRAIRRVLDDMDRGIAATRACLAKAKSIKQGMMKELLTGRTRLLVMEGTTT